MGSQLLSLWLGDVQPLPPRSQAARSWGNFQLLSRWKHGELVLLKGLAIWVQLQSPGAGALAQEHARRSRGRQAEISLVQPHRGLPSAQASVKSTPGPNSHAPSPVSSPDCFTPVCIPRKLPREQGRAPEDSLQRQPPSPVPRQGGGRAEWSQWWSHYS